MEKKTNLQNEIIRLWNMRSKVVTYLEESQINKHIKQDLLDILHEKPIDKLIITSTDKALIKIAEKYFPQNEKEIEIYNTLLALVGDNTSVQDDKFLTDFSTPLKILESQVNQKYSAFCDHFWDLIYTKISYLLRTDCVNCICNNNLELVKVCSSSISTLHILTKFFEDLIKVVSLDTTLDFDPRIITVFRNIIQECNTLLNRIEDKKEEE